ncbi:unnamed protein product [Prorocentrum cordatum]|uniref:Uncharacterized protein n=1 Tax=Prorocentrum cordatum TaxID=2364126 RepID=A0ABN9U5H4_9DINO|nr:unnamed protein product [Polarella glacialis]
MSIAEAAYRFDSGHSCMDAAPPARRSWRVRTRPGTTSWLEPRRLAQISWVRAGAAPGEVEQTVPIAPATNAWLLHKSAEESASDVDEECHSTAAAPSAPLGPGAAAGAAAGGSPSAAATGGAALGAAAVARSGRGRWKLLRPPPRGATPRAAPPPPRRGGGLARGGPSGRRRLQQREPRHAVTGAPPEQRAPSPPPPRSCRMWRALPEGSADALSVYWRESPFVCERGISR